MKVRNSTIPPDSLINQYLPANYSDSFECETDSDKKITPDDIQVSFWTTMPGWVNQLFKLRNLLVKPFGLQAGEGKIQEFKECIRSGGNCSFASVTDKSPQETIVCLDDKHLCAYLSIHIENLEGNRKKIRSITVVHFHYWLGYVYFYTICPFHYLVVRNMLRYTLKKLI
ncbi:DUF2867 domain-containing protein [Parabacteroides faecis]|jgi:bll0820 protein|uniref:DUF2867 domain-containing protein n=1 Tax=Parabacteroides faecis TaxID=1217282 RepID=A0ABR6KNV8_9BACT|nr:MULTISPECIES: DUF2867 domain-containing protein [Parabacteroides]MBB4622602.1 hypothetical protein [Parabacteroides faecis]MBC8619484.1 DUF2867 domain-containing protein [Parabacteroides faecis]RHR40786.1 DUF2867 domain-containing protein [Parabacteroides sp. AF18-52]RHR97666.1 DUF2867 domain-containing protein [Parabacteroides sp. AF14-59]GGK09304.1 hypothetical protein GCM10007084_35560 [Parabacteroides faecis]